MNETILSPKRADASREGADNTPRRPQVRALRSGVNQFAVDLDVAARVRAAAAAVMGDSDGSLSDATLLDPRGPGAEQYAILFMRLKEDFRVRVSGVDAINVTTVGELIALFEDALGPREQTGRIDVVYKAG